MTTPALREIPDGPAGLSETVMLARGDGPPASAGWGS
jgi:hypothetical protein